MASLIGNRATARLLSRTPAAAAAMVARHTSWGHLDRHGLAVDMIGLLPADPGLFEEVFAATSSNARDDVAGEIVALLRAAPDPQARVTALAAGGGRHALLRVVRELQAGWTFDSEARDMRDVLVWLEATTPTVSRYGSATIEIEVITFDHGVGALDWAGEHLFGRGAKGHTAIFVGGLAYSFDEAGWEVGATKDEYLRQSENTSRDGTGQVLDISMHDARVIQNALDRAANGGVYLLGGDVCSDATGRALNTILRSLRLDHNPAHLRAQLAAVPLLVLSERHYHNGVLVPDAPRSLPAGAGDYEPQPAGAGTTS